jgi:hypothetical protein
MIRDGDDEGPTTITVSIEVVLAEAEPEPTSENDSESNSVENPEINDPDISSEPKPPNFILSLPFFRFRFIEGSCVETPTVQTWEEVITPQTHLGDSNTAVDEGDDAAAGTDGMSQDDKVGNKQVGEDENIEQLESQKSPPKRWKWTKEFPIDAVDDNFLMSLNENPHFICTLGNKEVEDGEAIPLRAQAPPNTGSLLGFLPMDVSPLLDGDTSITRRCCSLERGAGYAPEGLIDWSLNVSVPEPLLNRQQRLRFNPLSIHFQRVVRVPGINIEETRNPRMLKAMLPTRFALLNEHCFPIFGFCQINVKRSLEYIEYMKLKSEEKATATDGESNEQLKDSDEYQHSVNTFERIVSTLPIAQEIASELKGPTEEELKALEKAQKKRARQKGKTKGKKKGKQPSTEGDELGERDRRRRDLPFNHKTVILAGLLDRVELLDYLNKGVLQFELHDRDICDKIKLNKVIKEHERMITGDPNPNDVENAMKRAVSILTLEQKGDADAVLNARSNALSSMPRNEGMDPFDIMDKLQTLRNNDIIVSCNTNTHGVANIRLNQLASYTGELIKGFSRERKKEKWMTKSEKIKYKRRLQKEENDKNKGKNKGKNNNIDIEPDVSKLGEDLGTGQQVKMREILRPTKRKTAITDDEEQESWDYSEEQRLVRNPGAYLLSGTEVVVTANIARNPLSVIERKKIEVKVVMGTEANQDSREGDFEATRSGANGVDGLTEAGVRSALAASRHFTDVAHGNGRSLDNKFERAVFCFSYDDEFMLQQVQGAMYEVNQKALPEASLRSHKLTEEETLLAKNGELDVITGFTVIDDAYRLIIVEGLGAKGMQTIHKRVTRTVQNGAKSRILSDPTINFNERLYTEFDLDLKRIRLRDELPRICESPDIYNRAKVPLEVFEALHRLFRVRTSMRLRHVRDNDLFPSSFMLLRLESKYGEAISLVDMDGQSLKMDENATLADDASDDASDDDDDIIVDPRAARMNQETKDANTNNENNVIQRKSNTTSHVPEVPHKRKADTDCWNEEFEKFLLEEKTRKHPDFIGDNERLAKTIKAQILEHRASLPPVDANLPPEVKGNIFIYSGQKLQLTEIRREQMKKKLAKRKNITFTYSSEFQSQTLCLVNEDDIEKDAKNLSKSKMTTKGGFVYPAPKDPEEYKRHPRQVSQSRRDQLKEPWEEPGSTNIDDAPKPWELPGSVDFDTIPDLKPKLFGGYRKDGTQEIDEVFFRSVHMGGDGVEKEMLEAMKKKKQEWLDAVIVDNIHYQPHYGEKGDKPSQLGKLDDILSQPPQKLGLKIVHRAKLPSGKLNVNNV